MHQQQTHKTHQHQQTAVRNTLFLQAPNASTMARWSLLPCAKPCRALSALACSPNGRWNGALSLCRTIFRGTRRWLRVGWVKENIVSVNERASWLVTATAPGGGVHGPEHDKPTNVTVGKRKPG